MLKGRPDLTSINSLCQELQVTFTEMSQAVGVVKNRLQHLPFLIRPFAERDFSSSMGFEIGEWQEFLQRLAARMGRIAEATEPRDHAGSVGFLRDEAMPFLERAELTVEKIRTFQRYTAESPAKLEQVPRGFMSDEDREQIAKASEYASAIGEAAEKLTSLKEQLTGFLKNSNQLGTRA